MKYCLLAKTFYSKKVIRLFLLILCQLEYGQEKKNGSHKWHNSWDALNLKFSRFHIVL